MRSPRERCLEGTVFIQNTGWGLSPHSRSNHEAHIVKKCCPIAIEYILGGGNALPKPLMRKEHDETCAYLPDTRRWWKSILAL